MKAIVLALATVGIFFQVASAEAQTIKTLSSKISKIQKTVNTLSARALVAGPQGPTGPQGPQGPAGPSAFNTIPSGAVVYGTMGGHAYDYQMDIVGSLPAPAPIAIDDAHVVIKPTTAVLNGCVSLAQCVSSAEQVIASEVCPGDADSPRPTPGYVCVYPVDFQHDFPILIGTGTSVGLRGSSFGPNNSASKFGFTVEFETTEYGYNRFAAVWAYRAP